MSRAAVRLVCLLVAFAALAVPTAHAHPLAPAVLTLRAEGEGTATMTWRTPLVRPKGKALAPRVPRGCEQIGEPVQTVDREENSTAIRMNLRCEPWDLTGVVVTADGFEKGSVNVVVRIVRPEQPTQHTVLDVHQPTYTVAGETSRATSLGAYVLSGMNHLFEGYDHLVFILGLLVLFGARKELLFAVTAFTIGHSVTLALAFLDIVRVPQAPVEILIAGTIVLLGVELLGDGQGLVSRRPWSLPMLLGLLHGMGFASALRGVGVPQDEVPLALFGFNVGIELGQLVVIAAALALFLVVRRAIPSALHRKTLPAYIVGSLGAFWMLDRAIQVAGGLF